MPTGDSIQVNTGTGPLVDTVDVSVGGNTHDRQVVSLGDPSTGSQYAGVTAGGALQVDASATLQPTTVQGATVAATTGTITTSTSTVAAAVTTAGNLTISIHGTYAGVNAIFEASDDGGTTYYTVMVTRADGTGVESTTGVIASLSRMWETACPGWTNFRVRATAYTSGTANIKVSQGGLIYEPNPTVIIGGTLVTQPVSGTVTLGAGTAAYGKSSNDASSTTAVAAGTTTAALVVKASAGRCVSLVITTVGTANCNIYDNASAASGTVLQPITTSMVVGQVIAICLPAALGITVGKVAGSAAFTIGWN